MTHHDPDETASDRRLGDLLGGMADDDFVRHDPPAHLADDLLRAARMPEDAPPVVVSLRERSRSPRAWLLPAAAIVALGIAVGVWWGLAGNEPSRRLLASADLNQLEELGRTKASAELVTEGGKTHLVIDATDMAPAPEGSEYELWLIDPGVTDPRSLGVVTGSEDVVVPSTIDPGKYPIVDISLEPKDGDHRHSGHSLMRGELR